MRRRSELPVAREMQQRTRPSRDPSRMPLMREDRAIGAITLWRMEPRRFTDKQVALVKTFADQAAIAIENVRLFNETKEALEQQTAISEILRVISQFTHRRAAGARRDRRARRAALRRRRGIDASDRRRHPAASRVEGPVAGSGVPRRRAADQPRLDFGPRPARAQEHPGARHAGRRRRIPAQLRNCTAVRASYGGCDAALPGGTAVRHDRPAPAGGASVHGSRSRAAADLRRPGGDRARERTAVPRNRGQEPPARGRQQAQVGVPRQHVARAADAAQCHHRLLRGAARASVRRVERQAGRLPEGHPLVRPAPALAHQRHSRPVEGRGGPDGAGDVERSICRRRLPMR